MSGSSRDCPADEEWGDAAWDPASLDQALAAPPGDKVRNRLVGDLLATHFQGYAAAVSGTTGSFIELDKGLAEISRHAHDVLGVDAVVLLLDELVLWLSGYIGDPTRIKTEAQKVSKLVESAEHERPAPIISFVPRQRDLRDLVGQDTAGATTASLFDTLKYWDGRFDRIKLEDSNLPAIVAARLLRPRTRQPRQPSTPRSARRSEAVPRCGKPAGRPGRRGEPGGFPRGPTRSAPRSCTRWWTFPARCSGSGPRSSSCSNCSSTTGTRCRSASSCRWARSTTCWPRGRPAVQRPAAGRVRAGQAVLPAGAGIPAAQAQADRAGGGQGATTARLPRRRPGSQDAAAGRAGTERPGAAGADRDQAGRAEPWVDRRHDPRPGAEGGGPVAAGAGRGVRGDPRVRRGQPSGRDQPDRRQHRRDPPAGHPHRRPGGAAAADQGPAVGGVPDHRPRRVHHHLPDRVARDRPDCGTSVRERSRPGPGGQPV